MVSYWRQKRSRDSYYYSAKRVGFRSRASFKLLEIDRKFRIVIRGDIVLDLGAAPGGWLQVASEAAGEGGLIIGVDLVEIRPLPLRNVITIRGDITDPGLIQKLENILPRRVDVLLADLSPRVSGAWETDHARQLHLAQQALALGRLVLKQGGKCVVKLFQGRDVERLVSETKSLFHSVQLFKPKASRSPSAEIYLVGHGFRSPSSPKHQTNMRQ